MEQNVKWIKTISQVKKLVRRIQKTRYCSFDFETHAPEFKVEGEKSKLSRAGFQWKEDSPTIIGISYQDNHSYIIPLNHKDSWFREDNQWKKILRYLSKHVFENMDITKIAQNAKFEHKWLKRYGCDIKGVILDPMLMHYLLDENSRHGLKEMVAYFFPEHAGYDDEIAVLKRKHGGWGNIPLKPLGIYCGWDCQFAFAIATMLEPKLIKNGFYNLYRNMYMGLHRNLLDTEYNGMGINREYLESIIVSEGEKLEGIRKELESHPTVQNFKKKRDKRELKELIASVNQEIDDIRSGEKEMKNPEKGIRDRETKISKYIAGEFTTKKLRERFNSPVNFSSPDQLRGLLFSKDGFGFESIKKTKDKNKQETDKDSTDEEVLKTLAHYDKSGFMQSLLDYRSITKLYGTNIKGMQKVLTAKNRVHTGYKLHGTVTGRLSSADPNLQNIPRDTTSGIIKQMFIPPPGHLILEVDYSQAELRVLAEMADDEIMIDIFRRGYNIHLATGLKLSGEMDKYEEADKARKDPDHPDHVYWKKLHKRGKVTNFSVLYGQSPYATAETLSEPDDPVTVEQARKFQTEWFEQFPGVNRWKESQYDLLHEEGYVYNIFGQKRRLPDIWLPGEQNRGFRMKAMRDAINAPIQGSAAHFTNFANVILHRMIRELKLPLLYSCYTVHDSIGFYIKPHHVHEYVPQIIDICANPQTEEWFGFQMKKVNMKVSAELGVDWGNMVEYDKNTDYNKLLI